MADAPNGDFQPMKGRGTAMSSGQSIRVVRREQLVAGPETAGMIRSEAIATDDVWLGEAHTEPGAFSGWHHHGEHTTVGRVLEGTIRFEFGDGGEQSADGGPGDYFMVPPGVVHREGNPGTSEQVVVVVRVGSGPTVVNVDAPDGS